MTAFTWHRSPGYGNARPHNYVICESCKVSFTWGNSGEPRFCPMCGEPNANEKRVVLPASNEVRLYTVGGQSIFPVHDIDGKPTARRVAYLIRGNKVLALAIHEEDFREFNPDGGDLGLPKEFAALSRNQKENHNDS